MYFLSKLQMYKRIRLWQQRDPV